jgi:hypothetical protein
VLLLHGRRCANQLRIWQKLHGLGTLAPNLSIEPQLPRGCWLWLVAISGSWDGKQQYYKLLFLEIFLGLLA